MHALCDCLTCGPSAPAFAPQVIDHYERPRNVGSLNKNKTNVGTGLVGAPACGDVMKLQIEVDDHGRIIDAKFKTFGCGSAIASSSLVTEMVKGRTMDEALQIKNSDIAKELRLPPVKIHCSCMCTSAMRCCAWRYPQRPRTNTMLLQPLMCPCWIAVHRGRASARV